MSNVVSAENVAPKVAVVTGASRGIGAALVAAYRRRGYAVVATSRTITATEDPKVASVAGDIADRGTAKRVVAEAMRRFGRIDTLINNAGIFLPKPFIAYSDEDYERMTAVNTGGFFHMTQYAIAQMLNQGSGGHVVTMTSTLVEHADRNVPSALTALTKGAIAAATTALAIEYAREAIRVNAVSLGVIDTPMHAGVDVGAAYAKLHPQNRIGAVTDVVSGVMYLQDAPFVTGEILHVDGGQSAGR
jgi:NAD(P)-dependent dehydrogenase (short-subunit alcohol dehydrogenase family)